ncbi:MAG: hypothetical protein O4859_21280, partial [Trichodesmium sp. St18_bin1]|nr:hypothetical protein [Trichodesmium sp. St18_bin1]
MFYLEVIRYFLKWSDRLLPPFDFLPVFSSIYSAFQIDELHRHNQNLVGTLYATSLLWSADMKTAVNSQKFARYFPEYLFYLEVNRYFLKWSDRLLPPFDFLPVFSSIYSAFQIDEL